MADALVFRLKDHVGFSRTSTVKAHGSIAEKGDRVVAIFGSSALSSHCNVLVVPAAWQDHHAG